MKQLSYGSKSQVVFDSWEEYYYALGFLANSKNAELRWEHNEDQGAWGSEGRIHCLIPETSFPQYFLFTAGRGNVYARINCNDYVATLVLEHKFVTNGRKQNIDEIKSTVPDKYWEIFDDGYIGTNPPTKRSEGRSGAIIGQPVASRTVVRKKAATGPVPAVSTGYANKGDRVRHPTHGTGTVVDITKELISVRFAGGVKDYNIKFAFENGYLVKL